MIQMYGLMLMMEEDKFPEKLYHLATQSPGSYLLQTPSGGTEMILRLCLFLLLRMVDMESCVSQPTRMMIGTYSNCKTFLKKGNVMTMTSFTHTI